MPGDRFGDLAKQKAEQAIATARPEYLKATESKDRKARDEALGKDAAALSGITVRLDKKGDVTRLVLTYVGAFKSKSLAKEQLSQVESRFRKLFAEAEAQVADPISGTYRAMFKGLTQDAAKDACGLLKAKRVTCMVVSPG